MLTLVSRQLSAIHACGAGRMLARVPWQAESKGEGPPAATKEARPISAHTPTFQSMGDLWGGPDVQSTTLKPFRPVIRVHAGPPHPTRRLRLPPTSGCPSKR